MPYECAGKCGILRRAKKEGLDVSGEVTAHHLLLNEMAVENANHKMNPPLRSEEDRQALIQGLLMVRSI